jgi:hypothetical protein
MWLKNFKVFSASFLTLNIMRVFEPTIFRSERQTRWPQFHAAKASNPSQEQNYHWFESQAQVLRKHC